MKALLAVLWIFIILAWAYMAYADGCFPIQYIDPRTGQLKQCQECCFAGQCQIQCYN